MTSIEEGQNQNDKMSAEKSRVTEDVLRWFLLAVLLLSW